MAPPRSQFKTNALAKTQAHKDRFYKEHNHQRIKEIVEDGMERLLEKITPDTRSAFVYIYSGMYEIRCDKLRMSSELRFTLACHLDSDFQKRPRFFKHGPMKQYIQVGYHHSYLTVEKRRLIRDAFLDHVHKTKRELLEKFSMITSIVVKQRKSFEECGHKKLRSWIDVRFSSKLDGYCKYFCIYGAIRCSVEVTCEAGEYKEIRNLIVDAQSYNSGSIIMELINKHPMLEGMQLDRRLGQVNRWGPYVSDVDEPYLSVIEFHGDRPFSQLKPLNCSLACRIACSEHHIMLKAHAAPEEGDTPLM
jgi:hypothetical protein